MHGLINRSIQCFVRDTYGAQVWNLALNQLETSHSGFEAMLRYDDALTWELLDGIATVLNRSCNEVMEDIGTYLVSHENTGPVRRLLRFSGVTFADFLHSLEELHDRANMAVPGLEVPSITLVSHTTGAFSLKCRWKEPGFGFVLMGILRGMADDYGALVFLNYIGVQGGDEVISVEIVESDFAEGRSFLLAGETAASQS